MTAATTVSQESVTPTTRKGGRILDSVGVPMASKIAKEAFQMRVNLTGRTTTIKLSLRMTLKTILSPVKSPFLRTLLTIQLLSGHGGIHRRRLSWT